MEAYALSILGIDEKDLKTLKVAREDKREFIRLMIDSSDPSFGRFMTQVYQYYQRLRTKKSSGKGGNKELLRETDADAIVKILREKAAKLTVGEGLSDASAELCVLLYRLSRAKAQ